MSNIVSTKTQLPDYLAKMFGKPSAIAQAIAGGLSSGFGGPRISIKGGRFRIVDDGTETVLKEVELTVVIVGANPGVTKTYYEAQWTPDAEPGAPDCGSIDGIRPDPEIADPQNDLCAGCPMNAFGSRVTAIGTKVKACSDQKRLAVVAADDPEGTVYLLQVTPAAIKGLNQFQKELTMRGIPVEAAKTVIGFDTSASFPKLTFSFGGFLSKAEFEAVSGRFGSEEVNMVTGVRSDAPALPPPAATKALPPAAPVAAPEEAAPAARGFGSKKTASVVVQEEAEEVAPARGFGSKKAAPAAEPKAATRSKAATKPAVAVGVGEDLAESISSILAGMSDDD